MPLPVAHAILGASVVAAARPLGRVRKDLRVWLLGVALGVAPDFDLFFSWVFNLGGMRHGRFTHSIIVAAAAGVLAAHLCGPFSVRNALVLSGAALSHGLLDVVTRKEWSGAALFWPFDARMVRLGLFDYFEFFPHSGIGSVAAQFRRALEISCYEVLIFGPVLLLVIWGRRKFAGAERREPLVSPER